MDAFNQSWKCPNSDSLRVFIQTPSPISEALNESDSGPNSEISRTAMEAVEKHSILGN